MAAFCTFKFPSSTSCIPNPLARRETASMLERLACHWSTFRASEKAQRASLVGTTARFHHAITNKLDSMISSRSPLIWSFRQTREVDLRFGVPALRADEHTVRSLFHVRPKCPFALQAPQLLLVATVACGLTVSGDGGIPCDAPEHTGPSIILRHDVSGPMALLAVGCSCNVHVSCGKGSQDVGSSLALSFHHRGALSLLFDFTC